MSDKNIEKIDWYKLLGIKRKKEENKLNDENTDNFSICKKPKKNENNSFEDSFKRLQSLNDEMKNICPNLIDKKSFSLRKILSEKLNIQSIFYEKKEKKELTKTTNENTIKDGNNTKIKSINYSEDADDSDSLYISDTSEIKEEHLDEISINQNESK
jgi:hypothetical protein